MADNIKGDEVKIINGKFESVYMLKSEHMLSELNKVSPSFCLAKWYNVSIHIPTGQTHSCYHPKSHHVPMEEIAVDVSALHNTKYKKEQRKKKNGSKEQRRSELRRRMGAAVRFPGLER